MVAVDEALPKMTASSAALALRRDGDRLWLAYLRGGDESGYAVLRFDGVDCHSYGPPNDEGLACHPLWGRGLKFYEFHRVEGASPGKAHWLATFHDGTLDVVAACCRVVATELIAESPEAALAAAGRIA